MRIRKSHHRNAGNSILSVDQPEDVLPVTVGPLLKLGWDGDGRSNSTSSGGEGQIGKATTGTRTEQSGMDSVTTTSRQSASPGVSMMQRGLGVEKPAMSTEQGMTLEPDPEGSTLSVEQLWQGQDGAEHVARHYVRRSNATRKGGDGSVLTRIGSSMAAAARLSALKSNGKDGIKRTCKSQELPSVHGKTKIPSSDTGALKRKLPLETDRDLSEEAVHPSTAPEGSVLHTLYLQLLAAGSEGITLRELSESFKKQTALPSLASDWKEQVRVHLKNNPHFDEVKGHYLLSEQLLSKPKRSYRSSNRRYLGASPRTTTTSGGRHLPSLRTTLNVVPASSAIAAAQPSALPLQKHEGIQTRRKAYEKVIEAVLTESAIEFQKMQQSLGNLRVTAGSDTRADSSTLIEADPADSQAAQTPPPTSRKRKSSSDTEELGTYSRTIRGSLQALQARILAETGVQKGVPCSRKDDARKWRCPLVAMEGHTLCEHHKILQLKKREKKQEGIKLARRSEMKETKLTEAEPCPTTDKDDIDAGLGGVHAVEALMDLQGRGREREYDGVVQPRRISFHNTVVDEAEATEEDAVPNQVEEELSEGFTNHSPKAVPSTAAATTTPTFNETSRKRQTPSDGEPDEVDVHYERAIPGSLKALQAKIVAESGEQSGVRCARKDGSNDSNRKWQCPLDALPGHPLCKHHSFLKERKRARYIAAKKKKDDMKLAGGQCQGPDATTTTTTTAGKDAISLPERATQFDAIPAISEGHKWSEKEVVETHRDEPVRKSRRKDRSLLAADETIAHEESTDTENEHIVEPASTTTPPKDPATDDDSKNAITQLFKSAPKKRYVAAKKTAASVDVVKEKSQERETSPLIRPPTIPPLPAMYGVRRKTLCIDIQHVK